MTEESVIMGIAAAAVPYRVWFLEDPQSMELYSSPVVCWLLTHQHLREQYLWIRIIPGIIDNQEGAVKPASIDHNSCIGVYPEGVTPDDVAIQSTKACLIAWSAHRPGCECDFANEIECQPTGQS